MANEATKPGASANAPASEPAGEQVKKTRKAQPPRIPPGHKQVKFYLSDAEHAQAFKHAEDSDRASVDDYTRAMFRQHLRLEKSKAEAATSKSESGS